MNADSGSTKTAADLAIHALTVARDMARQPQMGTTGVLIHLEQSLHVIEMQQRRLPSEPVPKHSRGCLCGRCECG